MIVESIPQNWTISLDSPHTHTIQIHRSSLTAFNRKERNLRWIIDVIVQKRRSPGCFSFSPRLAWFRSVSGTDNQGLFDDLFHLSAALSPPPIRHIRTGIRSSFQCSSRCVSLSLARYWMSVPCFGVICLQLLNDYLASKPAEFRVVSVSQRFLLLSLSVSSRIPRLVLSGEGLGHSHSELDHFCFMLPTSLT